MDIPIILAAQGSKTVVTLSVLLWTDEECCKKFRLPIYIISQIVNILRDDLSPLQEATQLIQK